MVKNFFISVQFSVQSLYFLYKKILDIVLHKVQ